MSQPSRQSRTRRAVIFTIVILTIATAPVLAAPGHPAPPAQTQSPSSSPPPAVKNIGNLHISTAKTGKTVNHYTFTANFTAPQNTTAVVRFHFSDGVTKQITLQHPTSGNHYSATISRVFSKGQGFGHYISTSKVKETYTVTVQTPNNYASATRTDSFRNYYGGQSHTYTNEIASTTSHPHAGSKTSIAVKSTIFGAVTIHFGDGSTKTIHVHPDNESRTRKTVTVTHTYSTPGNYTVSTHWLRVHPGPITKFFTQTRFSQVTGRTNISVATANSTS